jgi:hypothetical protein
LFSKQFPSLVVQWIEDKAGHAFAEVADQFTGILG